MLLAHTKRQTTILRVVFLITFFTFLYVSWFVFTNLDIPRAPKELKKREPVELNITQSHVTDVTKYATSVTLKSNRALKVKYTAEITRYMINKELKSFFLFNHTLFAEVPLNKSPVDLPTLPVALLFPNLEAYIA